MDGEDRKRMIRQMVDQLESLLAMDPDWCNCVLVSGQATRRAVAESDCWVVSDVKGGGWHMRVIGMLNGLLGAGDERIVVQTLTDGPRKGEIVGFWVGLYRGEEFLGIVMPDGRLDTSFKSHSTPEGDD